jgi:soluble lytic murein transglycosylase-like protein
MVVSTSVPRARKIRHRMFAAAISAAALSSSAHALERINLTNGFTIDCTRHEQADNSHIRLIYATGTQLLRTSEIASIDILPDPPKPSAAIRANLTTSVVVPSEFTNLAGLIATAGVQRNIDVDLLASVIHNESGFHVKAVSSAGARGLMQLMPATARTLGVQDTFNPGQNINGGAAYLEMLLKRYYDPRGDDYGIQLAIAAYNAGPGAVDRYHGIPPYRETRAYVARVLNEFVNRKKALKKPAAEVARRATPAQTPNEQAANEMPAAEPAKSGEASR